MFNLHSKKRFFCVDDFYADPYAIRKLALAQDFYESDYHRGRRTQNQYLFDGLKERFESIIGKPITKWHEYGMNGRFQFCTPEDSLVYHCDSQMWAGVIYLTPDAPYETGTSFLAHKTSKVRHADDPNISQAFNGYFMDKTPYETVDIVGNIFNRLIIWDGRLIHSASQYFGNSKENARLFQVFFFDT